MDPVISFQTTSVAELVKLYYIFDVTFDVDNSTFKVWFDNVGTGKIQYSVLKILSSDHSEIEKIILSCFLEKRIMWKDLRQELADDCISNLKDLSEKLKEYKNQFENSDNEAGKLLSSILLFWLMECIQAKKEFDRANSNEDPHEDDYFDSPPYAEGEIVPIIGNFRVRTLKIAKAFMELLPEDNSVRNKAELTYYRALTDLSKYYDVNQGDIQDVIWKVELVKK